MTEQPGTTEKRNRAASEPNGSDIQHALSMLETAIKASNPQTEYYRGFRNALRFAAYLLDGKEPQYEGETWFSGSGNSSAEDTKGGT